MVLSGDAEFRQILYRREGAVGHLILNRPDKLNALGFGPGSSREEIVTALRLADGDAKVGCILISAAGDAFCAGGDIVQAAREAPGADTPFDEHRFYDLIADFNTAVRTVSKPTVAAVHGLCLGTAMSFVAQCDLVIAADDARFGLIEGRLGHPGASELVGLIGAQWAKFLILTGELIDAARAVEIGYALIAMPREELLPRALDLAGRIAAMPREGVILNKACVNNVFEAMGRSVGRLVGRAQDTLTKSMTGAAQAPDGRRFMDILRAEGMAGLKRAREQQYREPWLPPGDGTAGSR